MVDNCTNEDDRTYDLTYEGIGEIPSFDRHRAILLRPPHPQAHCLTLDRTIEYRYFPVQGGAIYLQLKIHPMAVDGIIVRNQLSEAAHSAFCSSEAVVAGIYQCLLLGVRGGEEEIDYVPYKSSEVILLDAESSWDVPRAWISVATQAALRQALNPLESLDQDFDAKS